MARDDGKRPITLEDGKERLKAAYWAIEALSNEADVSEEDRATLNEVFWMLEDAYDLYRRIVN